MNEVTTNDVAETNGVEVKHYALALDKDGNEIEIEIPAEAVGYVQEADEPTVH
jgi:hypothetical protein